MKFLVIGGLIALGFELSGCATIVKGTTQSVSVTTTPTGAEGAKCELKNSQGSWFVTTPGSAVVHKTKNDLTVMCKKDGYQDADVVVPAKFGAATAGNILAGGVIGLGVDAASGANYTYATTTTVPMVPVGGEPTPSVTNKPEEPAPATTDASPPTT